MGKADVLDRVTADLARGYLHADADPAETTAFERAYPSAGSRLRELHWPVASQ